MEPAVELAPPASGTLGTLRPPLLNLALFALTFCSAFVAGTALHDTQIPAPTAAETLFRLRDLAVSASMLWQGLGFAAALCFIMLCHEMGHFLLARMHGVDATWPFFIPAPLLSLIGTLGAVIRLRSLPRSRKALLDIGAAGPIAGFIATIPVLAIGLKLSPLVDAVAPSAHWSLFEAILSWAQGTGWPSPKEAFDLGTPLGMELISRLVIGTLPAGKALALHPVAIAGWFGFLLTALNLLPMGQLDGGHVLFGASPRLHRALGPPLAGLLVALGLFTSFFAWIFWGTLMGVWLGVHPELAEPEPALDGKRKLLIAVSALLFILSFCPEPLALLAQ